MNKFKRLTSLILAMILMFNLVACNSGGSSEETEASQTTEAPATSETEATTEADTSDEDQGRANVEREADKIAEAVDKAEQKQEENDYMQVDENGERTIVDMAGNKVKIPDQVDTCLVMGIYPLSAAISNYHGSAEKIIGLDQFAQQAAAVGLLGKLYPEILEADTSFNDGENVNIETILALDPDVVFLSAGNQEWKDMLDNAGLAGIAVEAQGNNYNCIETFNDWFNILHQVWPYEGTDSDEITEYANEVYEDVTSRVANIPEEERVKVLSIFRYTDSDLMVSGKNFFGNWWIETAGGINVASEIETNGAQPASMEQIYEWNPEVIHITNFSPAMPEDLYNNTFGDKWELVDAVQNERVHKMPLASYRTFTPGVDTPVTLYWVAQTMYPEEFADIDIKEEFRDYYKDFFGIELSDEDLENIVNPPKEAGSGY